MAKLLAYGTLMWDNALATHRGEQVRVDGMRREFLGQSTRRWGTPEHPCPQVALVPGNGCAGVLFHIPFAEQRYLFRNLKQREGIPLRPVRARSTGGRTVRARCFLPDGRARRWADADELLEALRTARGLVGTGAEYVRTIVHAMELWGIEDRTMQEVWERIRDWAPNPLAEAPFTDDGQRTTDSGQRSTA